MVRYEGLGISDSVFSCSAKDMRETHKSLRHAGTPMHKGNITDFEPELIGQYQEKLSFAARFVGYGAVIVLITNCVLCVAFRVLAVDLGPIIVLLLLPWAREGSMKSWFVLAVLFLANVLVCAMGLAIIVCDPSRVKSRFGVGEGGYILAGFVVSLVLLWSSVCAYLAISSKKVSLKMRRKVAGQCVDCGYDLRGCRVRCLP